MYFAVVADPVQHLEDLSVGPAQILQVNGLFRSDKAGAEDHDPAFGKGRIFEHVDGLKDVGAVDARDCRLQGRRTHRGDNDIRFLLPGVCRRYFCIQPQIDCSPCDQALLPLDVLMLTPLEGDVALAENAAFKMQLDDGDGAVTRDNARQTQVVIVR